MKYVKLSLVALVVVVFLFCLCTSPSVLHSQANQFCGPLDRPDLNWPCSQTSPPQCPTRDECNRGWQLFAPTAPMTNIPVHLIRQSCTNPSLCSPGADGKISIQFCFTDTSANQPKCAAVDPSINVANIPLRTWCNKVRTLPLPPACSTQPCGTRFAWVGFCGTD